MKQRYLSSSSRSMLCVFTLCAAVSVVMASRAHAAKITTNYVNHLAFLAGDPSVSVSFNAVNSGVGGGLAGLIITSTTTGEDAQGGGNKVVEAGVQSPPDYEIVGVRVCYETTGTNTFISQIRIAQVQNPPSTALVLLDDGTNQPRPGPVCVNSTATSVKPKAGPLLLSLRVNFGNTSDKIVLRGVALLLKKHDGF